ncbi:MAG TPA: penicillin-binding protein 1C [Candidatus Eremiobacteraceae bacterium]|nr:penicillin-binding protein 1C [Candidatus Eremiobacteraceae bacterium]
MRTILVEFVSRRRKFFRLTIAAALACAAIRVAPFFAPIHVSDLDAASPAVDFTDRDGLPLGTLLSRDQTHTAFVPLAQVSPDFLHAIVAAEDGRFYRRGPVDAAAAARAAWQMIESRRVVSGASTIPMQLARMIAPGHEGVAGKALEVWGAWRVAAGMSRDQILEAYVNRLPMGGNVYGVEAAARSYFGIPAAKLDLAQASLLAALPNDPTGLNPYAHMAALRARQRYVLQRMVADGFLTAAQESEAQTEVVAWQPHGQGIVAGAHFLFFAASTLPRRATHARTTLDLPLQQFVEAQIRQTLAGLAAHDVHQAAALVVDNRNGDVLAYAGSADYFDDLALGRNDGVQSLRQPGSTLKPFLYQNALENHVIRPNSILEDTQAFYAIPGGQLYSPNDYSDDFLGPVRVRIALADSLNVPAVRVLSLTGVGNFLDRLHALGFAHLTKPAGYYGLGLTLGSGEVSLWELTHAYLTAARSGDAIPLRILLTSSETASYSSPSGTSTQVGDPDTWRLVTDMLADPHARAASFGVDSMLAPPFPAAVKTGTSSDYRDTWTVGYTSDYTVGVWVGNFDGRPMRRVSGVTGAAPLWNRIMLRLHERRDPAPFVPPALVRKPICAATGAVPTSSCAAVVWEYLYPQDLLGYYSTARPAVANSGGAPAKPHAGRELPHFRIAFPRDGDEFVLHATSTGVEIGRAQALELQAVAPRNARVQWRVNGAPVAARNADGMRAIWPLRAGRFTVEAYDGSDVTRVHIDVRRTIAQPLPRGFSTAPPAAI